MRVAFFRSDKAREGVLGRAFCSGVRALGDDVQMLSLTDADRCSEFDCAAMVGVKARGLFELTRAQGTHVISLDKGYCRKTHWRVAVNAHHPVDYVGRARHQPDRWERLGIDVAPWRSQGRHIIFAGASPKYHEFSGLPPPTEYAAGVVRRLKKLTEREIIYRPKPSWKGAEPVDHATYSVHQKKMDDELRGAHALVTHGSNSCFDAMVAGVPSVILGDGVARPISSTAIEDAENPRLASNDERMQLLANLAYCQFTLDEFADGRAWSVLRPQIIEAQSANGNP